MTASPLVRAWGMAELGRFPDAERMARQVLTDEPDNSSALMLLARTQWKQGRPDQALDAAARAVAAAPEDADVRLELALIHTIRYEGEKAIESAVEGIRLAPQSRYAHQIHGEALRLENRYQEAWRSARTAAELDPAAAGPWRLLGEIHLDTNNFDRAEEAFRQALSRAPEWAGAHDGLARVARGRTRIRPSLRRYATLARIDPTDDHSERLSWPIVGSARDPRWLLTPALPLLAVAALYAKIVGPWLTIGVRVFAGVLAAVLVLNALRFLLPGGRTPWRALRLAPRWRRYFARTLLGVFAVIAITLIAVAGGADGSLTWFTVALLVPYWTALIGYWVTLAAEDKGFVTKVSELTRSMGGDLKRVGREFKQDVKEI